MWAKLDLQLGPADGHRPGPPVAGERAGAAKPWNHQEQPSHHPPQKRRRGPAARARDERRRQDWLAKKQEVALEQPESLVAQEQSHPEQQTHELLVNTVVTNTEPELELVISDTNSVIIPQLDCPAEAQDTKQVAVKECKKLLC